MTKKDIALKFFQGKTTQEEEQPLHQWYETKDISKERMVIHMENESKGNVKERLFDATLLPFLSIIVGSVRVHSVVSNSSHLLKPSQQSQVIKGAIEVTVAGLESSLFWKNGDFISIMRN